MNDLFQVIFLSIIQGITEFLPISSSAHLILIPKLFGWIDQNILIDVSMHFGSLLAVIFYFILNNQDFKDSKSSKHHIGIGKLFIGSMPVLIFGFLYHDYITTNLRSIEVIAISTLLIALLFILTELLRDFVLKRPEKNIIDISNYDMLFIGLFQALALVPGTSRSAIIILGALLLGYNKKSTVIIALVLSFPVILLAMLYEIYSINYHILDYYTILKILISITISFLISYIVIKYFISYINKIGFYPFMIYRIFLGLFLLTFFT